MNRHCPLLVLLELVLHTDICGRSEWLRPKIILKNSEPRILMSINLLGDSNLTGITIEVYIGVTKELFNIRSDYILTELASPLNPV